MLLTYAVFSLQFQFATTEATRKILKKHAKRTALPVSPSLSSLLTIHPHPQDPSSALVLTNHPGTSLAQMLVQAVGETVLPIVPHIDDYECVICTSIAFKPIRLRCGHLFCVRCVFLSRSCFVKNSLVVHGVLHPRDKRET